MTTFSRRIGWALLVLVACCATSLVFYVREEKRSAQRSFELARMGAENGEATEQYNLGFMYSTGQVVIQDYSQAIIWYRKAAAQGNAMGENGLGFLYSNGHGVPQDFAEALRWYRKAAEQNNSKAEYNIGTAYLYGRGIQQDRDEAYRWYRKAADDGNEDAQRILGERWIGRDIGSRFVLPVVLILSVMLLASNLRSGLGLNELRYRAIAVTTVLGIVYLAVAVYLLPRTALIHSLFLDHASFFLMNAIIGAFIVQLTILLWPNYRKSMVLMIIGIAFVGFNVYVSLHSNRLTAAPALHAFYLADGLFIGTIIPLGVALLGSRVRQKSAEEY
jgi:tetratricopeptide (TPR) repeat protein